MVHLAVENRTMSLLNSWISARYADLTSIVDQTMDRLVERLSQKARRCKAKIEGLESCVFPLNIEAVCHLMH